MTYKVVLEKNESGYTVHCPQLRGCWSQGKTKQEALRNIKEAIKTYLESLDEVLKAKEVHELHLVLK
ncbi:MAG: type II toxin-antitoxin system HicB family antitoxin [Elusimicrobia bacterium]|nr:type II toxin-antitoxin system HicB family antitoxin [Elusimicrobiota bacterium]